jgi:hypothetical protein
MEVFMRARPLRGAAPAALLSIILAAAPARLSAHHGWGGYSSQEFQLTGIVEQPVNLAGPHGTMKIRVDQQVWDITLAPPVRVTQAGLREDTIPVGATVTIHGHRSSDRRRFEVKTERVVHNGKTYNVYPDRK